MYRITDETLRLNMFAPSGTVRVKSPTYFVVDPEDVPGLVNYIMRVDHEVVKCGRAYDFCTRMRGEFDCLRQVIAKGEPYVGNGDPWQRNAPYTLVVTGKIVELWTR